MTNKTKKFGWFFEEEPRTAKKQFTNAFKELMKSSELLKIMEVLAREGGQNGKNQPCNKEKGVKIKISLITLDDVHKNKFLKAMRWSDLKKHLLPVAKRKGNSDLKRKIDKIDSKAPLDLLKIEDFGSRGLNGAEDTGGDHDEDYENNFLGLFRSQGATDHSTKKSARGGSFGLGKNALWASSNIGLVLGSSMVQTESTDITREDKENKLITKYNEKHHKGRSLRLFGTIYSESHDVDGKSYKEYGDIGWINPNDGAADSAWDEYQLADDLQLNRNIDDGFGTSLLVVGLEDSKNEDTSAISLFKQIKAAAADYFWPSIIRDYEKTEFIFSMEHNGKSIITEELTKENIAENKYNVSGFIKAESSNELVKEAKEPGSIARKEFKFEIPATSKDNSLKHGVETTKAELSIYRSNKKSDKEDIRVNKIALVRGFGMVVNYWDKEGFKSIIQNQKNPYVYGVLKVGEALDNKSVNKNAEMFFKAAENALHEKWTTEASATYMSKNYEKPQNYMRDFYKKLQDTAIKLCGSGVIESTTECNHLADFFLFGNKVTVGPRMKLDITGKKQLENGEKRELSGTVKIERGAKQKGKEWKCKIEFYIAQQDNKSDLKIPFEPDSFIIKSNQDKVDFKFSNSNNLSVDITVNDVENFGFTTTLNVKGCPGLDKISTDRKDYFRELALGRRITNNE